MYLSMGSDLPSAAFKVAKSACLMFLLSACHEKDSDKMDEPEKPTRPLGLGFSMEVSEPESAYPLPVVDNIAANGDDARKYLMEKNPIIKILSGFNKVWQLGDQDWLSVTDKGNGPEDFSSVNIVDSTVWEHNIAYVVDVTNSRSYEEALQAYLDDRCDKNFSVIDGFGPLAYDYMKGSNTEAVVVRTIFDALLAENEVGYFNVNEVFADEEGGDYTYNDENINSPLGHIVSLVDLLRQSSASTNPSKYYYSSPRPWRMNNEGQMEQVFNDDGSPVLEVIGDRSFQVYESDTSVVPALKYVRRKAEDGARKDGGYPSGHTNAGYLAAYAYAYAMPERFSEFLIRASELGENRIVAGMHSPVDVIGARIQSSAVAAAALYNADNKETKKAAYEQAGDYFQTLAGEQDLFVFAHSDDYGDQWAEYKKAKAEYRRRLTYGFKPDSNAMGIDAIVPKGAEVILETRLPYLTASQRRAVLYTTSLDSGFPLLDDSNGWGRLDYVAAADGYGSFIGDVTVYMDASLGRFHARDHWRNDIGGGGLLTKQGTGSLELSGSNSYSGGTVLEGGRLIASSQEAWGTGDFYLVDGTAEIDVEGPLYLSGNFTVDSGDLLISMDADHSQLVVDELAYIEGGRLVLDLSDFDASADNGYTILKATRVIGKFTSVTADGYTVSLDYSDTEIKASFSKN